MFRYSRKRLYAAHSRFTAETARTITVRTGAITGNVAVQGVSMDGPGYIRTNICVSDLESLEVQQQPQRPLRLLHTLHPLHYLRSTSI
jgi:hypothetical protein